MLAHFKCCCNIFFNACLFFDFEYTLSAPNFVVVKVNQADITVNYCNICVGFI